MEMPGMISFSVKSWGGIFGVLQDKFGIGWMFNCDIPGENHPLKAEMETVLKIIKSSNDKIAERVKWNAASYFYKKDIVTFNPRNFEHIHLFFYHPFVVDIKSSILNGAYKNRRMTYFKSMP